MLTWPDKDPDEVLDYQINWADRLGTDTIASSTWTVPSGITEGTKSNTTTTATIWLSGGTAGASYLLVNRVVTAGGRTLEESIRVSVREVVTGLVSLAKVKQALRIDTEDDDAILQLYIKAASQRIIRHLKAQAGALLSSNQDSPPVSPDQIPPEIEAAAVFLVGHFYRAPDNDTDTAFDGNELPRPVKAMLKPLRDPTLA